MITQNVVPPERKLLLRQETRAQNMESKTNSLSEKMAGLTLLLKKGQLMAQDGSTRDTSASERGCSYCKKPGNGAARCLKNPHRDKKCQRCGRCCHDVTPCWTKEVKERKALGSEGK